MTSYEVGQLMRAVEGLRAELRDTRTVMERSEARWISAHTRLGIVEEGLEQLRAKDRSLASQIDTGEHDLSQVRKQLREHEAQLAEARRKGARSIAPPALLVGGGLATMLRYIIEAMLG
jgi:chromosome segregation ATPase